MKPIPNTVTIQGAGWCLRLTTDAPMAACTKLANAFNVLANYDGTMRLTTEDKVPLFKATATDEE